MIEGSNKGREEGDYKVGVGEERKSRNGRGGSGGVGGKRKRRKEGGEERNG